MAGVVHPQSLTCSLDFRSDDRSLISTHNNLRVDGICPLRGLAGWHLDMEYMGVKTKSRSYDDHPVKDVHHKCERPQFEFNVLVSSLVTRGCHVKIGHFYQQSRPVLCSLQIKT